MRVRSLGVADRSRHLSCFEEILRAHLLFEKLVLELGSLREAEVVLSGRVQLLVRRGGHARGRVALQQRLVRLHECSEVSSVAFSVHFIKNYLNYKLSASFPQSKRTELFDQLSLCTFSLENLLIIDNGTCTYN